VELIFHHLAWTLLKNVPGTKKDSARVGISSAVLTRWTSIHNITSAILARGDKLGQWERDSPGPAKEFMIFAEKEAHEAKVKEAQEYREQCIAQQKICQENTPRWHEWGACIASVNERLEFLGAEKHRKQVKRMTEAEKEARDRELFEDGIKEIEDEYIIVDPFPEMIDVPPTQMPTQRRKRAAAENAQVLPASDERVLKQLAWSFDAPLRNRVFRDEFKAQVQVAHDMLSEFANIMRDAQKADDFTFVKIWRYLKRAHTRLVEPMFEATFPKGSKAGLEKYEALVKTHAAALRVAALASFFAEGELWNGWHKNEKASTFTPGLPFALAGGLADLRPVLAQWSAEQKAKTANITAAEKERMEMDGESHLLFRKGPLEQLKAHEARKELPKSDRPGVIIEEKTPLDYWKAQERSQPELAFIAYFYMLRLATSVECERSFSSLRLLTGLLRTRLLPQNKRNELIIRVHADLAYDLVRRGVPRAETWAMRDHARGLAETETPEEQVVEVEPPAVEVEPPATARTRRRGPRVKPAAAAAVPPPTVEAETIEQSGWNDGD
jgi:hypothetical protein